MKEKKHNKVINISFFKHCISIKCHVKYFVHFDKKQTPEKRKKIARFRIRETIFVRVFSSTRVEMFHFENSFWNFPLDMFINDSIEYEMKFKKRVASKKKFPWKKFNLLNEAPKRAQKQTIERLFSFSSH